MVYLDEYGVHLVSSSSMLYKEMYISMQYVGTYVGIHEILLSLHTVHTCVLGTECL